MQCKIYKRFIKEVSTNLAQFCLLCNLFCYRTFFPVVHQFLLFYGLSNELNSFDLHHSAHLYALLTRVVCFGDKIEAEERKTHSHWDLVKDATSLVEQLCRKLLKILSSPNFQVTFNIVSFNFMDSHTELCFASVYL